MIDGGSSRVLDRIPGARDAHDNMIKSPDARHAFRALLALAMDGGREVRCAPHGSVTSFKLGRKRHPSVRIAQHWLAFYTTPHDWRKIQSIADVTPDLLAME